MVVLIFCIEQVAEQSFSPLGGQVEIDFVEGIVLSQIIYQASPLDGLDQAYSLGGGMEGGNFRKNMLAGFQTRNGMRAVVGTESRQQHRVDIVVQ